MHSLAVLVGQAYTYSPDVIVSENTGLSFVAVLPVGLRLPGHMFVIFTSDQKISNNLGDSRKQQFQLWKVETTIFFAKLPINSVGLAK